jgi:hypothetical protein
MITICGFGRASGLSFRVKNWPSSGNCGTGTGEGDDRKSSSSWSAVSPLIRSAFVSSPKAHSWPI